MHLYREKQTNKQPEQRKKINRRKKTIKFNHYAKKNHTLDVVYRTQMFYCYLMN